MGNRQFDNPAMPVFSYLTLMKPFTRHYFVGQTMLDAIGVGICVGVSG